MLTLKSLVSSFLYTEKIRKNIYDQQCVCALINLPCKNLLGSLSSFDKVLHGVCPYKITNKSPCNADLQKWHI